MTASLLNLTTRQQFQAFEAIRSFAQPENIDMKHFWTLNYLNCLQIIINKFFFTE